MNSECLTTGESFLSKTIYCEIQAVQIVNKILNTLRDKKTQNLLIGMFTPKEELKLLVYAELYKLNRLGFIKIKKVKKYLWVKFTDRGVENIFRFLELDMGDVMRRMAELKGFKVLEVTIPDTEINCSLSILVLLEESFNWLALTLFT